jgi:hypothetical protein
MFSTRRQSWFSLFRPAPAGRKNPPVCHVRPRLEILEDRLTPGAINTATTVSAGAPTFSLFSQTETVTTLTNFQFLGATVALNGPAFSPAQQISITDGGQTRLVNINSDGTASATFKFTLLQELQNRTTGAHTITATYTPTGTVATTNFNASTGTGTAPGNPTGFLFQLALDFYLYQAFVASRMG